MPSGLGITQLRQFLSEAEGRILSPTCLQRGRERWGKTGRAWSGAGPAQRRAGHGLPEGASGRELKLADSVQVRKTWATVSGGAERGEGCGFSY